MINLHRCCKSLLMTTVYFGSGQDVKWYMHIWGWSVSWKEMNDSTIKGKQFWEWHSLKVIMNNPGPTHLLSVPQIQALPWIKCRKGLSHPTKEQADSKAQRVRERKTPIYSFTALFSPSDLLSLPPLSYTLPLFCSIVFLNLSLLTDTHTLIEIHSFNSAHSQAQVRQPHFFFFYLALPLAERKEPCKVQPSHRTQDPATLSAWTEGPGYSRTI